MFGLFSYYILDTRLSIPWSEIRGKGSAPVDDDALNHLAWISPDTQGVHFSVLVDSRVQAADCSVAHHLVLPCAVVLLELVLKNLYRTVVYADADAIGLALVERPEGYGVDNDVNGVTLRMEFIFYGFILSVFGLF